MDQLGGLLLAFPPQHEGLIADNDVYHHAALGHMQFLDKILKERSKDLVSFCAELFNVVDPAVNSLSYLTLLHALVFPSLASSVPQEFVLEKVVTFMMTFDGRQCRYAGPLLLDLLEAVGSGRLLPPAVAVETLATAILRLNPSGTVLTSSHILLAKLAYDTNNIQLALPVIDKPVVFYPGAVPYDPTRLLCDRALPAVLYISKQSGLTALIKNSTVLEYELLCGMMYCAVRDWDKARAAFERAVTFPTKGDGCSKIMVDAFKRWVLVSLLVEGYHSATPPYTTTQTIKYFEALARPYIALATAFATDDVQQLKQEFEKNVQFWVDDATVGLVEEVMASYQKWRILSLEHIYTKISIPEIRQQTKNAATGEILEKDEDVEMLVQNMVASGMLKGGIEKNHDGTKFLVFFSPTISEEEFTHKMQEAAIQMQKLSVMYSVTNQRLGTTKEYIKWALKDAIRETKRDWNEDPSLGYDSKIDDEDLMGGLTGF